jgi:hypothetical protein
MQSDQGEMAIICSIEAVILTILWQAKQSIIASHYIAFLMKEEMHIGTYYLRGDNIYVYMLEAATSDI